MRRPYEDKPRFLMMQSKRRLILTILLSLIALASVGFISLSRWPGLGAQLAKPLRGLMGNEGVAQIETIFFTLQDAAQQLKYQSGLEVAEAPWEITTVTPTPFPPPLPTLTPPNTATLPATATSASDLGSPLSAGEGDQTNDRGSEPTQTPLPTMTPTPKPPPTPAQWTLPAVNPLGSLAGEGVWQPYLTNQAGEVVAVRTFLQPDPERPYALAAIVAFNLEKSNLHYVLGSEEPALPDGPRGTGRIDEDDKQPGKLLAAFNGGFMASHGEYGAMADGLLALPAKDGYATVTIGEDGRVQIGEWGLDILADGAYESWRQNARLITQNGLINDRVYNGSAATWGSSINGDIVTWRSGLGLSQDEQILYFVVGPSLSMPSLAAAMTAVKANNSMLLDINETWVHFAAIQPDGASLTAVPLLPEGMDSNPDRYLKQSPRDFFYITTDP